MRIAFVIPFYLPAKTTGPIRHTQALARGLAERGHYVSIIAAHAEIPKDTPPREAEGKVEILRLAVKGRWGFWIRCPDMRDYLAQGRYDIIHAQGYRNYLTEVAATFATRAGVPFVLSPRGSLRGYRYLNEGKLASLPNLAFDLLTRKRALREAVVVAATREEAEDAYSLGVPHGRVRTIPHGIDFSRLPKGAPQHADGNRLLFVGRIAAQRNVGFLLRGFARALRSRPQLELSIVGEPIPSRYNAHERRYFRRLMALAQSLPLQGRARFLGGLYGNHLWEAYAGHDLFVYTSRYDNFGHALVEAAYFGLPLISTSVGIAPELVHDGEGGLLVAQDNVEDLANAIVKAATSPLWCKKAGDFLRRRCRRYDLAENVTSYERLYESRAHSQQISNPLQD